MAILAPCRGNVYKVDPTSGGAGGGKGFYKIEGLDSSASDGSALLVNSVVLNDRDVVLPVITLENTRILYTFGADFGDISVTGLLLLGKAGGGGGQVLSDLIKFFKTNRVSEKKSVVSVTGPSSSWNMFVTGLVVQEADPQIHAQPFQIVGKLAEPK